MTLPIMIYGAVVTLLIGGAAHFLDGGFRSLRWPTRWIWLGALLAGGLAPFFPRLVPEQEAEALGGVLSLPVALLYEAGTVGASTAQVSQSVLPAIDGSLTVLWIIGSGVVLLALGVGCLRLRRLRATWDTRRVGDEDVLLSDDLGPAVVGLYRPRIVLPRWALALQMNELETVILHEREHREARDPALLAAGLLLTALSPWNPVLWWALLRLRLAVEGDCDRRVLARGVQPRSYVRLLLDVASSAGRAPVLAPALTEYRNRSLERRLVMIRSTLGKRGGMASALAVAAGLAFIAVACETPLPQEPSLAAADLELQLARYVNVQVDLQLDHRFDFQHRFVDIYFSDPLDRLKTALANRYTIERELGRGGMAVVYLAGRPGGAARRRSAT